MWKGEAKNCLITVHSSEVYVCHEQLYLKTDLHISD